MTILNQVYKCEVCWNIVEIINNWAWTLVCCGKEMKLMQELKWNEWLEKHVPVVEKTDKWIKVKVWSMPHPMQDAHYIQRIEVLSWSKSYKKFLKPTDLPEAEFPIDDENVLVRAYCNIHWLRKN